MYCFPVKVEERGEGYIVTVPGEGYIVTVPAVPGCVTGGRTREEVLRKVREVLRAILIQAGPCFPLAGSAFPQPRDGGDEEYVDVALPSLQPC